MVVVGVWRGMYEGILEGGVWVGLMGERERGREGERERGREGERERVLGRTLLDNGYYGGMSVYHGNAST
jgi:hypothetical protein